MKREKIIQGCLITDRDLSHIRDPLRELHPIQVAPVADETQASERGLSLIGNSMGFLLLPGVRVPHPACHVLGRVARRIRRDWEVAYGHPVVLLETFVEKSRFAGTCYQAANWILVGETTGRTRNGHNHDVTVPIKLVYLYPLTRHFRTLLSDREN